MTTTDYNKFWSPAFDDMRDFVCLIDCDYNLVKANESFLKVFGGSKKNLIGKKCFEIFHSLENPFPGCPHGKMLNTAVSERGEFYEPSLKKHLSVMVTPIWGDNHKLIGSIHIAEDVTQLKEEEEKYRNLVENINHIFFVLDKKARLVHMNRAGLKSCGYKNANDFQGRNFLSCVQKKHQKIVVKALKEAWRGKTPQCQYETRISNRTHQWWNGCFIPMSDDAGKVIQVVGLAEDITEQKKSARIMKFYKEYAENIVGNLPLSLLIVNRDLCVNFANRHFLSKMRVTKENVTERELAWVMGKPLIENTGLGKKIMQVIKGEEDRIEDRFIFKGRIFNYMIVPLKEQTGRRRNALLIMEDATKNAMMEQQLIHAEKLSAVGRFTASVAHEINNPLSIVVGNIQYLLSNINHMNLTDKKEVEELVGTLTNANAEAKRCAGIITNLLHFSHKEEPEKTKVSINSVVNRTIKLLAHQLKETNVQTIIKLADGLPFVMGNEDRLQQVFVNLILNAQQVMKEGGKLYITTSLDNNYVATSFRDTGPGIPKKYIRKIFEPFYSTKEAGKGTGLGLFIVHSVMEEHRGKIEVQSKRGQGATFILKLPAVKKGG